MYTIDVDILALSYTDRGLTISFIVGIFGANCLLILKTIQKGGFFYTPKSLTLISLAIGDIFLALFALVVRAINVFEGFYTTSCSTQLTSNIYLNFLVHFVYATGLVVLAAELVHRYRKQTSAANTKENILKALACSAFPWILALVIILPLMLAGSHMNSSYCTEHLTAQRVRSAYGVSVILPAVVAVIICIVVMCIRLSPAYYTSPAVSYQVTNQATFVNPQTTQTINQQQLVNPVGNGQYPVGSTVVVHEFPVDSTGTQQQSSVPDNSKLDSSQAFSATYTQYPAQQYPVQQQVLPQYALQQYPVQQQVLPQYAVQQYPVQQQVLPQYAVQQYPTTQYVTQPNVVIAAPVYPVQAVNTTDSDLSDLGKERKILLLVSIIHFMCVVPNAVYILGSRIDGYEATFVDLIVSLTLLWLSLFRSLITPCIFSFLNK
ncbi:hypothetical protein BsWGS_16232 [Bradybaena similaris]